MLLLTAFEPFDGSGLNSSALALQEFTSRHPERLRGVPVASVMLPVSFGEDVRVLRQFLGSLPAAPSAILHLGQTYRAQVGVETRAVNLRLPSSERDWGTSDELIPIDEGAPPFLESTFPAEAIVSALREAGVPCQASTDAGTYLCNHILFRSLREAQAEGSGHSVGFVHLPRLREQLSVQELEASEPPHLPLQVLARAVEVAARAVAESLGAESEEGASST